jgi:hypothetical protein
MRTPSPITILGLWCTHANYLDNRAKVTGLWTVISEAPVGMGRPVALRGALMSVWTLGSHAVVLQQYHHCQFHACPAVSYCDIRLNCNQ